jgi:hypothetical protein
LFAFVSIQNAPVKVSLCGPNLADQKNHHDHSNPGSLYLRVSWALSNQAIAQ